MRRHTNRFATLLFTIVLALVASSCTGGTVEIVAQETSADDDSTTRPTSPAVEPTAVPPPAPTSEPVPERSIEDVAAATVKIRTEGSFIAPLELEQSSFAGIGTGFIIDPNGLMVTNNHVVTGASIVEVYLEGSNEPTAARLLGVSECSDLAVLQLEGDDFEHLEFRSSMDGVNPGLPIFAAGYPLNFDTDFFAVDYTLTAGIVSTTQAGGETSWASIDGVIEHDARIRGGNSGGPLVDEQGRVVGINYAGEDTNDINVAIDAVSAASTIEALKGGDVESLGINGQAIVLDDASGVWVSAVASGSPADRAGIRSGDLITHLDGSPLALTGTMSEYCSIIRSNSRNATLSIEVVRIGSEEVLTGEINGTPLTQAFSFAGELSDQMASTDAGEYTEYEFISDDTNLVGVEVPAEWIDRDGSLNNEFGESIFAAPDLAAFTETWDVPGIIVERSTELTSTDIDSVLDRWNDLDCAERGGREDFATEDGVFTGKWEFFFDCGGTETAALTLAVSPVGGDQVVRMFIQIVTEADLAAADRALGTFDAAS